MKNKTVLSLYSGYAGNKLRTGAEFDMHRGTYDTPTPTSDISEPIMESEIMTKSIVAAYASYKLSDTFDFSINDNIIKIETKEVNKEITKIIKEIEQTATINNINIINSSLEDAFLKLTNK